MTTRADRGRLSEVLWPSVFGCLFFGPAMQVSDVLLFDEVWSWGETAARSAFFAVLMAAFSAASLLFSASARERAAVARTVTTGVLPEDGDWRGPLTAERRRLRSAPAGVAGLLAFLVVLVVVVTLLPDGPGGSGWLLAVGLALAGALLAVRERRRLQAVDQLLAGLGGGPAAEGESTHAGDRLPSA